MLMKMYQVSFLFTLVMGTTIACSANSWFTCWLGLEINLMSLIPLLVVKLTPLSTETAIKYFLAQAMASLMIIFTSLMTSASTLTSMISIQNEIILIALCVKMGMAPFHFWFPQVMKIATWVQCTIILTWQKIAPFILVTSLNSPQFIMLMITLSALTGGLGGLNQMMFKTIMTYSSIGHSAWMLAICHTSSISSWLVYFSIYSTISVSIIMMLYSTNTSMIYQTMVTKWNNFNKINFMISMMSLGGLPPFLGFLAKLSAIQIIMIKSSLIIPGFLIVSSLVSLYYYTRVIYMMLLKSSKVNMIFFEKSSLTPNITSVISLGGNILAPFLVLLI